MSRSNRNQAVDKLEELKDMISAERLLYYVISNYLSGSEALNAMICAEEEFFPKEDEDEDEEDEDQVLEIGMEVEVVDEQCNESVLEYQDIGTITEISGEYFRVVVDGRPDAGNWMRAAQLARINY